MAFPRSCMLILATWSKSLLVAEGAHLHDGGLNLMEDTQLTPSPAPVTVPAPAAAAPLTIQAHTLNVSVRNFKKSLKEVVARLCGPNDDIVVSNLAPERVDHLRTAGDIPRVLQDLQIGANFPGTVQLHDANGGVIPAETKIKWKNRMREGCSNCRTGIEALLHTGYKVTVTAIVVTVASINPGAIGGVIGTCATTFVLLIPAILINLFHPLAGASLLAWGVKTGFCIGGVGGASLEGSVAGLTAWDDLTEDSEAKIQPRIEAFWERKIDGRVRDWANALDARMHGYGEGIRDRGLRETWFPLLCNACVYPDQPDADGNVPRAVTIKVLSLSGEEVFSLRDIDPDLTWTDVKDRMQELRRFETEFYHLPEETAWSFIPENQHTVFGLSFPLRRHRQVGTEPVCFTMKRYVLTRTLRMRRRAEDEE